jgi:hypothetical protein
VKPVPAIVESANDLAAEQVIVWRTEERDAETSATRWEQQAGTARATARARRLQIGELCAKQREKWPLSGPNARGWGLWLAKAKLDDSTAWRYIEAWKNRDKPGDDVGDPSHPDPVRGNSEGDDEPDDGGPRIRPLPGRAPEAPPFRQMTDEEWIQGLGHLPADRRKRILRAARVNVKGGSGDEDRGTWCTSKEWAVAVGPWDLDPFSNPRSHIASVTRCMLEDGGDAFCEAPPGGIPGLYLTGNAHGATPTRGKADELTRVWIQPPYELVAEAIAHYGHTRFCALLRWSPDVKAWFPQLWQRTAVVCHPFGERMDFEPPPGVDKSGDMPFPHALYYAHEADVTDEVRARCLVWRIDHSLDCAQPNPAALQIVR